MQKVNTIERIEHGIHHPESASFRGGKFIAAGSLSPGLVSHGQGTGIGVLSDAILKRYVTRMFRSEMVS